MIEEWRDIPQFEGYQASNLGRIRSKNLLTNNRWGSYIREGKILTEYLHKSGYICVSIGYVHRLVAYAFLNHTPHGMKLVIDHKDNNPFNNRLDNLQLISNRENCSKDRNGGTSKYVGVSWRKDTKKWTSRIIIDGFYKTLGSFETEYEAHLVYQNELEKIKGT